jgi:two-component system response regulator WspF
MKIAIVNSLPQAVDAIRQVLASSSRYHVAWVAVDGAEAVKKCAQDKPDLVLMDMVLPVLNGVEATRQIMAQNPCAILIVTATVSGTSSKVFEALGAGAIDAINTPPIDIVTRESSAALLRKIEMVEKLIFGTSREKTSRTMTTRLKPVANKKHRLVVIGASAGGPMALAEVLAALPRDFSAAVIIVQHVDAQFAQGLADWLNEQSTLPVRLVREGEKPAKGTVLVAGKNDHLIFVDSQTLGYTPNPVDYVYRPSVDVFFESVVKHWKGEVVGVLLTGMGRDGARGLKSLRDAGCHTIAQDKASCLVYGMPKAAAALDAADEILPLPQIGLTLRKMHVDL